LRGVDRFVHGASGSQRNGRRRRSSYKQRVQGALKPAFRGSIARKLKQAQSGTAEGVSAACP
jgi:hypothetical protein